MDNMSTKVVFMGSPAFAVPILERLAQAYDVVGVVTQPDRPAGRGRQLTPPAVKVAAQQLSLPVIQPLKLRQPEAMEQLVTWAPDLIVVAAFGQILRPEVLNLPPFGCVNVHASLLPRWRGAAPIPAAILHGDFQSGVTIMLMDSGVDTGPILSQRALPLAPDETAASLEKKLSYLGAELLLETLPTYLAGELNPYPQDDSQATYAPLLKKEDGRLDLTQSITYLERQVRAMNPWPGAFYDEWPGGYLRVWKARPLETPQLAVLAGPRTVCEGWPALRASDGLLILEEVQPAGKKPMSGKAFLQGARQWL